MKQSFAGHTYYAEKISDSPVLIDLGSCRGAFAGYFRDLYPLSTIVMVEPSKSNFPLISLKGDRISKLWNAASGKAGEVLIFYEYPYSEEAGSCFFRHAEGTPYEVTTVTLDELVKPFEYVDLVKIDVEGAEWDIIDKATPETLGKIQQLSIEFHDFIDPSMAPESENAVQKLKGHGFNMEAIPTTYMHGTKYFDTLFYK